MRRRRQRRGAASAGKEGGEDEKVQRSRTSRQPRGAELHADGLPVELEPETGRVHEIGGREGSWLEVDELPGRKRVREVRSVYEME